MAGRLPLKQAADVRFVHSPPLGAGAIGSAADSDSAGSRFDPWAPSQNVFHAGVVQLDRTLGYEPRDLKVRVLPPVPFRPCSSVGNERCPPKAEAAGSIPATVTKVYGLVGERSPRRLVKPEIASSILVRPAKSSEPRPLGSDWSRSTEYVTVNSESGSLAKTGKRSALNRENGSSILPGPTRFVGRCCWQVAQRSCGWLLTSKMEVRILSCQPKCEAVRCMVHGRTYIPRISRSEYRLGSNPSTATIARGARDAGVVVW